MESLLKYGAGTKCSVIIESNGKFVRRNGVIVSEIKHTPGIWCVEITNPLKNEPYFTKAVAEHYEIIEPMNFHEDLINRLDEYGR